MNNAINGFKQLNQIYFVSFQGFGEASGEHWLGNEFVSRLSIQQSYKLRIKLSDWEGNSAFSQYDQFSLDGEAQNYRFVPAV